MHFSALVDQAAFCIFETRGQVASHVGRIINCIVCGANAFFLFHDIGTIMNFMSLSSCH